MRGDLSLLEGIGVDGARKRHSSPRPPQTNTTRQSTQQASTTNQPPTRTTNLYNKTQSTNNKTNRYAVPKPREQCTKGEQLAVSFAAGYIAGVFCAAVSHPADNLVSKLNAQKGATAGDIVKQVNWL